MRRYASYPTYSSVHPVGLISRVGASGIGCRMRRYASYPTYSSVPRRPDKSRQRRIRHRLSDATLCVLSDLQFSAPRRPDKSRQRRIRHRLSDATPSVLSDLQFSAPRRPDKSRQRRIRHRLSNTINGRFYFTRLRANRLSSFSSYW